MCPRYVYARLGRTGNLTTIVVLEQNIGDHVDKVKIFNIPKINPYV